MRGANVVSRDQEREKSMNAPLEKTSARREVKEFTENKDWSGE